MKTPIIFRSSNVSIVSIVCGSKRLLLCHIASRNEFTFKPSDIFSDARDPGGCSPEGFTHEILYRKPEERLQQG